jgi:hypothetical protein
MLTEGWKSHSGGCGDVPPSRDPTVPGMALQCPGWRHNGGDGRTGAEVTEKTHPAGLTSRHRPARAQGRHPYLFWGFRRPPSRGATWGPYESGRHSVTELTPALPHSSRTVPRMAAQGELAEQRRDMIPRRCQGAGVAGIRLWPMCSRRVRSFNALVGSGRGGRELCTASSEAEIRPRGCPALERGGVSVVRRRAPRARRRFARGVPRPTVWWAAEVAWAVGSSCHQAVIARGVNLQFVSSFVFLLFCVEMGFPPVIMGLLWLSPTNIF